MKYIIRNLFRYRLTAIFFIVGQLIIYVTIFGALNIYNRAYDKEADRIAAQYQNRIEMSISKMNKKDIISECGRDVHAGNIMLGGRINVYFTEKRASNRAEVLVCQNEEVPYELVSGRLPGATESDYGNRQVALGRYQYNYSYEEDGKRYVTFNNEKYEVVGVIGNKNSDYLDYKVVFDIHCIGENIKEVIREQYNYTLYLGSNHEVLKDTYELVYRNIVSMDPTVIIGSKALKGNGTSTIKTTLYRENFRVNIVVYIFCLLNCMLMSEFWIIERNREFAIRRTYGYSRFRIIMGIVRDILMLCAASIIIYAGIAFLADAICNIKLLPAPITNNAVLAVAGTTVVSLIVTIAYPVYRILKISPAVTLKDIG